MVAMAATIAGYLQPRLRPATGGPIDVDAAPGAEDGGGAAPAAAAPAAAPAGGRGRSRSRPRRDQPLPTPTAEAQRIEVLARQVQELQRRLDLAYAELTEYRKGGASSRRPRTPHATARVGAVGRTPSGAAGNNHPAVRVATPGQRPQRECRLVQPRVAMRVPGCYPGGPCARADGPPRRPWCTTGHGHKEPALRVDHGQPRHGVGPREQLPGPPHLRGPAPAASTRSAAAHIHLAGLGGHSLRHPRCCGRGGPHILRLPRRRARRTGALGFRRLWQSASTRDCQRGHLRGVRGGRTCPAGPKAAPGKP